MSFEQHLSLVVSDVLSDIGVNEETVNKWRQECLLKETLHQITSTLEASDISIYDCQIEESLVHELISDVDYLFSSRSLNSVQDLCEWQPGQHNTLIIQDETTSPGYCNLQVLRYDAPLPVTNTWNRYNVIDQEGRILLKNPLMMLSEDTFQHGPSIYIPTSQPQDLSHEDFAIFCNSWPSAARPWLLRQSEGQWPSNELRKSTAKTGCFLVQSPNHHNETEWKMSFPLAHRSLMFSLNITQIRCFILMKMIVRTYAHSSISDDIIKTVLFHSIENTNYEQWQKNNLLKCLESCLFVLRYFMSNRNCPDFFIHDNNLLSGKLKENINHRLVEVISHIEASNGRALLEIDIANFSSRLSGKLNITCISSLYSAYVPTATSRIALAENITFSYSRVLETVQHGSSSTVAYQIMKSLFHFVSIYRQGNTLEKQACTFIAPLFCSSLGSVRASVDINTNKSISGDAFTWLSAGINSDVSSGRLKLASALYCAGHMERTEKLLKETANRYIMNNSDPVCSDVLILISFKNIDHKKENIAYCVKFLRCEENCVPQELRYEMFRSSRDDMLHRNKDDYWMDCAVVDSLPYLYFLQYKVYKHLERDMEKKRALTTLAYIIHTQPNLGHRETGLNLLGQCMEKENRFDEALSCYMLSLQVRERNNAANTHICRLLAIVQFQRTCDANPVYTPGATASKHESEEQDLFNITEERFVEERCAEYTSNQLKKDYDDTLSQSMVQDMSINIESVGAIVSRDGVRGTVFRVGSKYVMTALHVVQTITNPSNRQDIPENDWSKLEQPNVFITFAPSATDRQSPSFYIKRDVIFMSQPLDVAVLELRPGNNLPRKLCLNKNMGQIEHVHLIGFGHPTDPGKRLDPNCKVERVSGDLIRRIETEHGKILERYRMRPVLQMHCLDPNILGVRESYGELFDSERFACRIVLEQGASGAPAIAENEVVGICVKGLPLYYYELKKRDSNAAYVQHFPNQLKFELCTRVDMIYKVMRRENYMLAKDFFDSN